VLCVCTFCVGEVAGIAIACFVFGVVIAAVIVFLIMRYLTLITFLNATKMNFILIMFVFSSVTLINVHSSDITKQEACIIHNAKQLSANLCHLAHITVPTFALTNCHSIGLLLQT